MGYYLGKNNTGDLASVLTGAYNLSSPTPATAPINAADPLGPLNKTTPTLTVAGESDADKAARCNTKCLQENRSGGGNFAQCMADCLGTYPGIGEPCLQGRCATGLTCINGVCKRDLVSTDCIPQGPCTSDEACKGGTCVGYDKASKKMGNCDCGKAPGGPTTGCPEGTGTAYAKNPTACPCGVGYATITRKCATGYTLVTAHRTKEDWGASDIPYKEGATGTCECTQAINDWSENKKGQLGEYKYPPEMQALMDLLLARGKEFMGLTPGFSQEAQDKMFGRGFENIRGQEAGQRTGMEQGLSRQGMLGTGAGQGMLNDLSWQTEGNVANLARDLFVGNEVKKKQDLLDYTSAAQGILGSGMGFEQLLEAVNASRRGEGSASLQALIAWLLSQQ